MHPRRESCTSPQTRPPHRRKKGTPLCNLYVSMLDKMGTPVDAFGDRTAPPEIS